MRTALVVGLGSAGRRHALAVKRYDPSIRVLGISSQPEPASGVDEILPTLADGVDRDPDVAILAGPATHRLAIASRLARRGVHLFLEKPIGTSMEDAERLRHDAEASGVTVGVGYNLRHYAPIRLAKQLIVEGSIGRVWSARAEVGSYLPDWRAGSDYRQSVSARPDLGGGALLELSHELDYMAWMLGMPLGVTATLGRSGMLDIDVEDTVDMLWRFRTPLTVALHLDMVQRPSTRTARFLGETGTLVVDLIDGTTQRQAHDVGPPETLLKLGDLAETYDLQISDFLDAVKSDQDPAVSLLDGMRTLELIDAALAAHASRTEITVGTDAGRKKE